MGIALNLYITLDSLKILTVLILPIHEHKEFIHLFVSSSMPHSFQCTGLSPSCLNLLLSILLSDLL